MNPTILEEMEKGLTIDQIRYKPIKGELLRDHDESKLNTWVQVHLQEGKVYNFYYKKNDKICNFKKKKKKIE